ncbi:hypothetical protein CCR75_005516 [Bremia lactucae]|uniref:Uncharacterized protein n=1 Tax=Bremia lactucae TaxID=4779 RepID=A0A976IC12_BRELC|nr:hypothetical protein CCR75_005516 [Bremia lactucae]
MRKRYLFRAHSYKSRCSFSWASEQCGAHAAVSVAIFDPVLDVGCRAMRFFSFAMLAGAHAPDGADFNGD